MTKDRTDSYINNWFDFDELMLLPDETFWKLNDLIHKQEEMLLKSENNNLRASWIDMEGVLLSFADFVNVQTAFKEMLQTVDKTNEVLFLLLPVVEEVHEMLSKIQTKENE